ncbi:MAG: hypothetical protein QXN05_00640 [Acidilobaceae archaeon]
MKILVSGLYHMDSGKTVLASSLVSALKKVGFKVMGFKPIGSTDIWSYPKILDEVVRAKAVVTRDGLELYRATGAFNPTTLNPVGGLSIPIDPRVLDWKESLIDFTLRSSHSRTALVRFTRCLGEEIETKHLINLTAYSRTSAGVREILNDLSAFLKPPPEPIAAKELAEVLEKDGSPTADSCLESLSERVEVIVAESNADIAVPTRGLMRPDLALVVAHNVVAVISGARYAKAVELRMRQEKPWSVLTKEVIGLLSLKTVELPLKSEPSEGYSISELEDLVEEVKSLARR